MPLFSAARPASISSAVRAMLNSSPDLSAADMAKADNLVAQTSQHTALAEKYRAEVESQRQADAAAAAARTFREDPANAINYASTVSGAPLAQVQQWDDARRGVVRPPATPNDDEGNPMPAAVSVDPGLNAQVMDQIKGALGSIGATRFATGPTNAEQMTKAAGNVQEQNIMSAVQRAIASGDMQGASAMSQGAKPGTEVKLFSPIGNTGATMAPATGDVQANGPVMAAIKAAAPKNLQHFTGQMGEPLAFDPSTGTAKPVMTPEGTPIGAPAPGAASGAQVSGPEFLSSLPKPQADQIRALAEGRMAFPTGMALKSPYWQDMLSKVSQFDPNFDAVNYNSRSKTRNDFTSGNSSKSLNALNTVMGHMDELEKAGAALNNTDFPLLNKAVNAVGGALSPDLKGRLNAFNLTRQAVASEMERAYRGAGGNLTDIEAWKHTLDNADSSQAIRASIGQAVRLLGSKIDALGETYNKGMGTTKEGIELLDPKAQESFNRLSGRGGDAQAGPQAPAAQTRTPAAAAAPAKPNNAKPAMPKEGTPGVSKSGRPMAADGKGGWVYTEQTGT